MQGDAKDRPTQNNWRQANVQKSQRQVNANNLPGCPKTPHEAETLRTPIQGQKRILDSHWGMFHFSDSLPLKTAKKRLTQKVSFLRL